MLPATQGENQVLPSQGVTGYPGTETLSWRKVRLMGNLICVFQDTSESDQTSQRKTCFLHLLSSVAKVTTEAPHGANDGCARTNGRDSRHFFAFLKPQNFGRKWVLQSPQNQSSGMNSSSWIARTP